jgi:aspartyl-tRNA(Asn)/glutamyl-tRNA(Gln) amidotransferase subunit B
MPVLPTEKREKYSFLGLSREQIESIISQEESDTFFTAVLSTTADASVIKLSANYLTTDVPAYLNPDVLLQNASVPHFVCLMSLLSTGLITSRVAKDLLREVMFDRMDAKALAEERGLLQDNNVASLENLVGTILTEHADIANEYRAGKEASLQFLIGQAMRLSKGSANPAMLKEIFVRLLKQ